MAKQRLHVGLLVHVPDLDVAVVAAAEEFVAVDAERHAGHGVAVALEHAVEGHVEGGPDFDYFVGAAGGEKFAVGGEGEAEHCGGVAEFGRFVEGDFFDHFPRDGVPFDDGAFLSARENERAWKKQSGWNKSVVHWKYRCRQNCMEILQPEEQKSKKDTILIRRPINQSINQSINQLTSNVQFPITFDRLWSAWFS